MTQCLLMARVVDQRRLHMHVSRRTTPTIAVLTATIVGRPERRAGGRIVKGFQTKKTREARRRADGCGVSP
jgi:hypothetical protein